VGCALSLLCVAASSLAQETVRLDLTISSISDISGTLAVAVFDSEASFDARSGQIAELRLLVDGPSLRCAFELPAPGSYAIIVFQDINGNDELDLSRIGIPQEPYGFSNNARSAFGPPSFRKARIDIDAGRLTHEISLR
jgi:uncharacterized protein (DUF2141 family)